MRKRKNTFSSFSSSFSTPSYSSCGILQTAGHSLLDILVLGILVVHQHMSEQVAWDTPEGSVQDTPEVVPDNLVVCTLVVVSHPGVVQQDRQDRQCFQVGKQ